MGIVELIEIGLANIERRRVEIGYLQPAEISSRATGGLAQVVSELAAVLTALSGSKETVRLEGRFDDERYHLSVSVGAHAVVAGVLDRMLEDPELAFAVASTARLAARHGVGLRSIPGGKAMTILVTVPAQLVARVESEGHHLVPVGVVADESGVEESSAEFIPHEFDYRSVAHAAARTAWSWGDTETFLEEVFAPLMKEWEESQGLATIGATNGGSRIVERELGNVAVLRTRVPGESYSMSEDGSPSTAPAEAAVDIRSALSSFDEGRRSAGSRH